MWLRHRQPPPGAGVPPAGAAALQGSATSRAISHHYDVSNRFYEWVLGPSMAYTCAAYPTRAATLEEAQAAKHELVAQKLALRAGDAAARRRLRLGRHGDARRRRARRQGAGRHALAQPGRVGAGRDRAAWADGPRRGAPPRLPRRAAESEFDAISSIGLTEHIGQRAAAGLLRVAVRAGCARRGGCSTTASPSPAPPPAAGSTRSSPDTSSPTASCTASGTSSP